ncbi:cuticle protein 21-like [Hetaerina americana]|uniref:cuticle protein 21-like n=1 Tax=Hetaerina americana TaxID=62018 RepID=UPI003A7F32AA
MVLKFFALAALVAVANAGLLGAPAVVAPTYGHGFARPFAYGAPVAKAVVAAPAIAKAAVAAPVVAKAYAAPLAYAAHGYHGVDMHADKNFQPESLFHSQFAAVFAAMVAAVHGLHEPPSIAVSPAVARFSPLTFAPVAKAAVVGQPIIATTPAVAKAVAVDTNFDPNPQYTFSYEIHDVVTGDDKAQTESRSGDLVQGQYTLVEPDGVRRTVDYTADSINGFNAVVHRNAASVVKAAVAAPVITKVSAIAAPVVAKVAAPLPVVAPTLTTFHHQAPIVKTLATPVAYSTPIAKAFATPVAFATPAIGKAIIH